MRRVVAVLGAVLMVVVALLVRGVIDGDDDSASGGPRGDGGSDGEVTLVCAEELTDVCGALVESGAIDDYDDEPAGETADRMATEGADLGADAWLTLDPFPGIADVGRNEANLGAIFEEPTATGFSTQPVVVVHPDRADAVAAACDEAPEWPCLGDLAGDPWADHDGQAAWGEIKIGLDDPDSVSGLLSATQAAAAHLGLDDFASNDLDASDTDRWLGRFEVGDDVAGQLVSRGPGAFSAVGTLEVEAEALQQTAQGADLTIFYPSPMFRAEVVLVAPGSGADELVDPDDLDEALSASGWNHGEATSLPSAGALFALREDLR